MRYDNQELRELLAAEYALGTLRGRARLRYEALMASRKDWQHSANWWAEHIHLLADTVPAVAPPTRVWKTIEHRLYGSNSPMLLKWWRGLAVGSTALATGLAFLMVNNVLHSPEPEIPVVVQNPAPTALPPIALLSTEQAKSGWILALKKKPDGTAEINATALNGVAANPDKSYELWVLPGGKAKPISLGVLPKAGQAAMGINIDIALLNVGAALAVTLEPTGGSPSGQPTGPVMYQGKLSQL